MTKEGGGEAVRSKRSNSSAMCFMMSHVLSALLSCHIKPPSLVLPHSVAQYQV